MERIIRQALFYGPAQRGNLEKVFPQKGGVFEGDSNSTQTKEKKRGGETGTQRKLSPRYRGKGPLFKE